MTWRFVSSLFVIPNLVRDLVFGLKNLGFKPRLWAGLFTSTKCVTDQCNNQYYPIMIINHWLRSVQSLNLSM